jgi:hypothetical protein
MNLRFESRHLLHCAFWRASASPEPHGEELFLCRSSLPPATTCCFVMSADLQVDLQT